MQILPIISKPITKQQYLSDDHLTECTKAANQMLTGNMRCSDDTAFVTDEPQHLNGASPEVGHAFLQSVSLMCHKGYTG